MAKIQNQHIYDRDQEKLKRLADEFTWLGREIRLEPGHLTVFALPSTYKKKTEKERRKRIARRRSEHDYNW